MEEDIFWYNHTETDSHIFNIERENEFHPICHQNCPTECETTEYFVSVDSLERKSEKSKYIILGYEKTSYIETVENPKMRFFTLFSNLGGALGLFFGMQLVNLIDIIDFFINVSLIITKAFLNLF